MMEAVTTIPPFEHFYTEHREAVFGFLARRLGRAAAEDAFQETFLRALRAYERLEHGRHLRAWIFTIAARVAIDAHRARPSDEVSLGEEPRSEDSTPAYLELEHLAAELPPAERAAVGGPHAPAARRVLRTPPAAVRRAGRPAAGGRFLAPRPGRAGARAVWRGDDVRRAGEASRAPASRTRSRHGDEPQPDPNRPSLPPRCRCQRKPRRLRRRARPKGGLAQARRSDSLTSS